MIHTQNKTKHSFLVDKLRIIFCICFLGFLFTVGGCKDQLITTEKNKNPLKVLDFKKPVIKNGALAFNSGKDFKGFLYKLQKQSADMLTEFIDKQVETDFTSLMQVQTEIKKSKSFSNASAKVLNLKIPDPNFASILNKHGVFQIEERVYKITNKYTYIFKNRDAFEAFSFPDIAISPSRSYAYYIQPCIPNENRVVKLQDNVYRATICGGGGGTGGGGTGGGSDEDNGIPPNELEPYDNIEVHYDNKRYDYYRSGGNKGRLKGKTWDVNYYVYSSVGAKTEHQRHTWLRWWDRTADKITLEAAGTYTYGKKRVDYFYIETQLTLGSYLVDQGKIQSFLDDVLHMDPNSTVSETFTSLIDGNPLGISVKKYIDEGYQITLYPTAVYYHHSKSNAKRIRKIFDWSSAVFSYSDHGFGIERSATNFHVEIIRSVHTLKHDGHYLGLITEIRDEF